MDRRSFLTTSALGAAALATLGTGCAPCKERKAGTGAKLRISFSEGLAPGDTLQEKFDFMESIGVEGLEPGGHGLGGRVREFKEALNGRKLEIGAICAGFDGFILAEDPAVKAAFDSSMREIICAAGELGSTGVVMVPAFNFHQPCLPNNQQTWDYLCEQLHELGEFALEHGTTVILEPLNRNEAFYLRHVAVAAAIARDSNSKGVKAMGDFWHMKEETSDYAAFMAAGSEYLQHVHIASRGTRNCPGEDGEPDNYIEGFRALKEIGYSNFVSLECGVAGPDRKLALSNAVKLMREQWEKA